MNRAFVRLAALAVALTSITAHADPTKDQCIDANESAQALRASGKLRDAMSKLAVCTSRSCPGPVKDDCAERLNDLQKLLPTVVFEVHSASGADVSAVQVKMDGVLLTAKLDGSSVAVDPGQHAFRFEADGFTPLNRPLLIREGDKARREKVILQADSGSGSPAVPTTTATTRIERPPGHTSTTRIVSYAALGVGVAFVAVGSVFGVMAIGDKSSLNDHCTGNACPLSQQSDINGFHSSATISDVGFGIGLAGIAAGVVMFFASRSREPIQSGAVVPVVSIGLGGAGLSGTF